MALTTPTPSECTPSLDGLRVAVTGGTSGLGLALVEALRAGGAEVAFVARRAERVDAVARRLPGTHGIAGDVSRKDETHPIALRVTAALGGLDVLIHNASSLGPVPLALLADTATGRIGAGTPLAVVDAIVTGAHQPGESHYELLRAFAPDELLARMSAALEEHDYRSHEFGDSVLVERQTVRWPPGSHGATRHLPGAVPLSGGHAGRSRPSP